MALNGKLQDIFLGGGKHKKKLHWQRILGPVCDNEKEYWKILTNKETYAIVKNTYHNRYSKAT
jgi:hypothetical protein